MSPRLGLNSKSHEALCWAKIIVGQSPMLGKCAQLGKAPGWVKINTCLGNTQCWASLWLKKAPVWGKNPILDLILWLYKMCSRSPLWAKSSGWAKPCWSEYSGCTKVSGQENLLAGNSSWRMNSQTGQQPFVGQSLQFSKTPCRVEASGWINPHVKHRHIIRLKPRLCKDSCWTEVSSMTKDIEFSPYLLGCQIYTGWYGIVLNNRCIEWCVFQ